MGNRGDKVDSGGASDLPTLIVAETSSNVSGLWKTGFTVEGRYHVDEVRGGDGVSGMGVVYVVKEEDRKIAVKSFQRRFAHDLAFIQRFIREARTWMRIGSHPNVVRAERLDIIDAAPYLFMEFVETDVQRRLSLADYLAEGPLPLETLLDFALQFCDGMIHATTAVPGLVHRDIKPENILIDPHGVLKIMDFGLVRCKEAEKESLSFLAQEDSNPDNDKITRLGMVFGTPAYMAPEQFDEVSSVTIAADVYAFACCLYECIAGSPPFVVRAASTLERVAKLRRAHHQQKPPLLTKAGVDCPKELVQLVMKCLAKHPKRRCQDFQEMRRHLEHIYESALGKKPKDLTRVDPSPREVVEQMRSLTLLDGYDHAIRLRNLRESQNLSPYTFHLALASYFHCKGDQGEERRQLEKAERSRGAEAGYEAARRLADLLIAAKDLEAAEALLGSFLLDNPEAEDRVLEPHLRLFCGRGQFSEARAMLDRSTETMRTRLLRGYVLAQEGAEEELYALLEGLLKSLIERLRKKIMERQATDCVGWGREGDVDVIQLVMAGLCPQCDCAILNVLDHAIWPDLSGYPDFAPDMAWLSQVLGRLSELKMDLPAGKKEEYKRCAVLLDYPKRLADQHERDEYWFWLQKIEQTD